MAKKLWVVIKREYLERVRTKWFLISTALIPVMLIGTSVVPVWLASRTVASTSVTQIAVLDATGAGLGARVARVLAGDSSRASATAAPVAGDVPVVRVVEPAALAAAESAATLEVMHKQRPGYLVLDAATMSGDSARYAGRNASSIPDIERIRSAVRQSVLSLRLETAGLDPRRVNALTDVHVRLPAVRISDKGRGGAGGPGSFIVGFFIAFLLYFSMAIYGQQVLRGVMEEKTTRVAEVVVSSVTPETLMWGKVLGVGAVGLTQQALWIGISAFLSAQLAPLMMRLSQKSGGAAGAAGARGGTGSVLGALPGIDLSTILIILLFFLLGYIFYSSLFAAAGATVNSEQDAQQAATPIALLLVPSFVFVQPIALNPTGTLAHVMSYLPFSAPIIMPMRMTMVQLAPWEILLSLASCAVGCAIVVWAAARIYRVGLLMYGKRPSFGELMRWIRYA